ncbi:myosin-XVIIIa isoform 1 [Cricetulus griseus]|nr:myosin-XVIIIa isoform 1 [Cricetulus griseus]
MFNLMKKDKDKDGGRKEKKEKKEKKERMSAAELRSLEEMSMRRGFFNLNRSSKRESKTRLEISNPIPIKVASSSDLHLTDIDSDSNRGSIILDSGHLSTASSSDDLKGEEGSFRGSVLQRAAKFGSLAKQNSQMIVKRFSFSQRSRDESASETSTPSEHSAAPSPQVEVRTLEGQLMQHPGLGIPRPGPRSRVPELVTKRFPADLRLPAVVPPPPPALRELSLQRRPTGDFGFSLRRTTMLDRAPEGQAYRRVVHFAEPGAGTKDLALGLVPGDRLVEINGQNVENKSRDEIVEMIRQSGDSVRLKVQPIPELSELSRSWLRTGEGHRREPADAKTEDQIAAEEAWYETEKVWLVHKDGFSLASQLKSEELSLPEGKVRVKLDHDGAILDVDEDDIEKANAPSCDRLEDLASLVYLNESSVLHTLRQRYGASLLHTYAGPSLLVLSPRGAPAVYSEKVMHMFKGCRREDMAPHIYAVAQTAYRAMLMSRQDQSIVLLGSSGSGKTTSFQHLVQYLTTIAGTSGSKVFSVEKWQALYTLLEAFGNSHTIMNGSATRFSQILSLDFDQAGQVASASIQTMLLEKLRVARRPSSEATFNVFYYLLACGDSTLRTELHLNHLAENNVFGIVPLAKPEEKQKAAQQFSKLQTAMKVLAISPEEQKACWLILASIYHLGAAGATKAGRKQFARHEWAQKAAYLLGCSLEELSSAIFKHQLKGGTLQRSTSFRQGPEESGLGEGTGPKLSAMECLEGMASGLYSELFTLLISLVNRALKSSQHSLCSMMIVDTPGFQNPERGGSARGASFEELCHNYAQDRLQRLFHERTFLQELERYKEENIELAFDDLEPATDDSVAAVDQASHQSLVRSLAHADEARGLLWLLEEEALVPGATEDALLDRLFSYYGPQEGDKKGQSPLLRSSKPRHFLLGHSHGTNWVEYNVTGWLNYTKQNPATQNAPRLLQDSQKKIISNLFLGRAGSATVLSGSIAGLEGGSQLALRRATSMRKTFTTGMAAVKKKSLCIQIKLQVDALIDTIKRSKMHFVHCFLPVAEGWPGEPRSASSRRVSSSSYPDHMVFSEFRRRFDVLAPHLTKKHGRNYIVMDEKRAVEELLESLDLEKSSCCMGLSRGAAEGQALGVVFFRAGTLARLEEQRDEQTSRHLTLFQAACRGYLSRQHFKKRKIQDLAIRCVQKNIKKNKGVKDWPWWKLFTTVRPLIQVQLSEEQIRNKDEEIQQLRSKLEKVEKERNELRLNSDRLETRISELTSELTDERNTGESASQLLDAETAERLRAEKEMKELQTQYDALKKQMEVMEMEVMEARLIRAAEINGEVDGDDAGGEWRLKYERAVREVDFTKKRLQQELEDKMEVEQQSRRQLERRLGDLQADSDESQRALQQLKKKCQRLTAELQDTKLHLEGQQVRNHELEKKQRSIRKGSSYLCEGQPHPRTLGLVTLPLRDANLTGLIYLVTFVLFSSFQLEEQLSRLQREKNEIQNRLEEDQEDMNELMKKHKAAVAQASRDMAQMNDLQAQLEESNKEKQELQEKLQALQSQVEFLEQSMVDKSLVSRQEAKIRELETRLEFEKTQVKRLESLANRLKENMEKLTEERDHRAAAENREKEQNKRLQRQLRDTKEEMSELARKEAEASRKKHELEMDLESLEAANQSLQADLKLAFKRIGDLQAAIEDEMESDENEDLINSLQDMVTKYQKRKNKLEGDSDVDSELEDRVDGVKSWLSKNKGPSKAASDDGSLKSSRTALNSLPKEGKGPEERPASALSSLSYRKRLTLKDSIGGTGDQESLLTTLSERATSPERPPRKARVAPREEPDQAQGRRCEEQDDCSSIFSGAGSRTSRGLEKRWGSDFDRASTVSAPVSRASSATRGSGEDRARSSLSFSLSGSPSSRRSTSRLDSLSRNLSPSWNRASGLDRESPDSRLSLGQSCLDEWDDGASVALSEAHSQFSHPSLARSLSVPPQPRGSASSSASVTEGSSIRPVSRHSYLDPDLEAAINEVLSYKPVPFQRSSLEPDSEDDDRKSIQSARSAQLDCPERSTSIRRSASAVDVSGSRSGRKSRSKRRSKRTSPSSSSSSSSSSSEGSSEHRRRRKGRSRKSKKKSKSRRKKTESESESSSSSSSGSTVSGHSRSSVKRGPTTDIEETGQAPRRSKKEEKQRKKEVDSLMMRYLYRPESD